MIKTSKHIIKDCNQGKISYLDSLFDDYKNDLLIYITYIVDGTLPFTRK